MHRLLIQNWWRPQHLQNDSDNTLCHFLIAEYMYTKCFHVCLLIRPNLVGRFGLMPWRGRPAERNHHRCSFKRVGHTRAIHCWRSFRTIRTGLLCRHSTRCWLLCHDLDSGAEFFGDDLASYRNSTISCLTCTQRQTLNRTLLIPCFVSRWRLPV